MSCKSEGNAPKSAEWHYNVQVHTKIDTQQPNFSLDLPFGTTLALDCSAEYQNRFLKNFPLQMTSRQSKLQEDTVFRVMRLLQENPDFTQRELAEKLGISVGGLNYCLKALMEKGMVKMKNFAHSKNKFGYVYVLTPSGMAEKAAITHRFLQRKMDEYEALKAEIEALQSETAKIPLKGEY
jgi:EPS-associated MarR family transcriptional regulator